MPTSTCHYIPLVLFLITFRYEPIWDGIFEAIEKWALKTKSVDVSSGLEPHPLISHREKLIKTTVVKLGH